MISDEVLDRMWKLLSGSDFSKVCSIHYEELRAALAAVLPDLVAAENEAICQYLESINYINTAAQVRARHRPAKEKNRNIGDF
jgi:hypothetical protein